MSLIIVAKNETERRVFEEAFTDGLIDVETCACFEDIKAVHRDFFVLGIISQDELSQAKRYADQFHIFLISDSALGEGDKALFEDVFISPVYPGIVVEAIKQSIQQQALHKALSPVTLGPFILDPKTSTLQESHGDKKASLTEKEMAILVFLSQNLGRAVSKEKLLEEVWEYAGTVETHTLETHMYRLRQKIQEHLKISDFLVTEEDGYLLKF